MVRRTFKETLDGILRLALLLYALFLLLVLVLVLDPLRLLSLELFLLNPFFGEVFLVFPSYGLRLYVFLDVLSVDDAFLDAPPFLRDWRRRFVITGSDLEVIFTGIVF